MINLICFSIMGFSIGFIGFSLYFCTKKINERIDRIVDNFDNELERIKNIADNAYRNNRNKIYNLEKYLNVEYTEEYFSGYKRKGK